MAHRVGSKGQIVIEKDIRDQLGVEPGWLVLQRLVNDHVEIYFLPPPHRQSLKGSLSAYVATPGASGSSWDTTCEAAWQEVASASLQQGEECE